MINGQERSDRARRRRGWLLGLCMLSPIAAMHCRAATPAGAAAEVRVRYDRRDLTTPAGARKLLHRIEEAAFEACGASPFSLAEVRAATRESSCWRDAMAAAVRRIDSPALSSLVASDR